MTKIDDETRFLNVVYTFFKRFDAWCGPSRVTPTADELENYLSKQFLMFNNGKLVVKGGANYLERLKKFQLMYSKFKISSPLEKPLIKGNLISIYYQLDLTTTTNQLKQIYVMGLFTIEDDKISRWIEVSHEKESSNWDKYIPNPLR